MGTIERAFVAQPLASAGGRVITSPFQFYTTGEDKLRVVSLNALPGVVIGMANRFVDTAGVVQASADRHVPNSNRTPATTEHELGVGALLNLTVFAAVGTPFLGQTFVVVQLIRGDGPAAIVLGTLLQGYLTSTQHLAWPGSPLTSSIDGPGMIRGILGTVPAAGAEVNETVPTGARWELISLTLVFQAGAAVAARQPVLVAVTPTTTVFLIPATVTIPASGIKVVTWCLGLGTTSASDGLRQAEPLPGSIPLLSGWTLKTFTNALQPADQYSAVQYTVREWLEAG